MGHIKAVKISFMNQFQKKLKQAICEAYRPRVITNNEDAMKAKTRIEFAMRELDELIERACDGKYRTLKYTCSYCKTPVELNMENGRVVSMMSDNE